MHRLSISVLFIIVASTPARHPLPLTSIEEDRFSVGYPRSQNAIVTKEWLKAPVEEEKLVAEPIDEPCESSTDCARPNTYCDTHYGECKAQVAIGEPCRQDAQCRGAQHCMLGICLPVVPSGERGAKCDASTPCKAGLCCAVTSGYRVCKPLLQEGDRCFVPQGGLDYALDHGCSCADGLVCARTQTHGKARKWLSSWALQRSYRCVRR